MECTHLDQIRDITPNADVCEECIKIGGVWVRLRVCMICGHVGCCEQSVHKHAEAHYHETEHPIIESLDPTESWWRYCYPDDLLIKK